MSQEEVIATNFENLIKVIETHISEPRRSKLIKLYNDLADRMMLAPASSHTTRHNCYPGGYVDHVLRVCDASIGLYDVWQTIFKSRMNSFTKEEMIFAALNHDLGKVGDLNEDYYVPNDSDWHIKRGQVYKINPKLTFMKVPDRSIYTLQQAGISFSENEYLAIKLHDGLYSKGNESYLMGGAPEFSLKTELPILLHHADHLSTLAEGALAHASTAVATPVESKSIKSNMTKVNDPVVDSSLKSKFDELFG
jgi:hypothetical protein